MAGLGRRDGVSGRRKGSPNKKTLALMEKAQALGIDPFEILLLFAKGDCVALGYPPGSIDPVSRLKAASDACQYLYPKRKAIQLDDGRNPAEDPLPGLSDEELDEL